MDWHKLEAALGDAMIGTVALLLGVACIGGVVCVVLGLLYYFPLITLLIFGVFLAFVFYFYRTG